MLRQQLAWRRYDLQHRLEIPIMLMLAFTSYALAIVLVATSQPAMIMAYFLAVIGGITAMYTADSAIKAL